MSKQSPVPHPEEQKLIGDINLLREELTNLLTEADDLVQIVKPNLLAIYQTKIGAWELRLLQTQCEMARMKRKVELAQASLNRGVAPDWAVIDGMLDLEFLRWQTRINEAAARIKSAEERFKNLLSPGDSHALKKLYYALVKKLHPDMNPALTEDERRLWLRVQEAYEAADLQELQALSVLAEKHTKVPPLPETLEALRQKLETLEKQIAAMLEKLERIESQPPFTLRVNLEDDAWVAARREAIDFQVAELQTARDALAAHLQSLMKGIGNGNPSGNN